MKWVGGPGGADPAIRPLRGGSQGGAEPRDPARGPLWGAGPAVPWASAAGFAPCVCERVKPPSLIIALDLLIPPPQTFPLQRPLAPSQGGKVSGCPRTSPPPGSIGPWLPVSGALTLPGTGLRGLGARTQAPAYRAAERCWWGGRSPQDPSRAPLALGGAGLFRPRDTGVGAWSPHLLLLCLWLQPLSGPEHPSPSSPT